MAAVAPLTERYVAIYVRISFDKTGLREGVELQEDQGREYATQHWPGVPVKVFADNNVSAFDDDAIRPGYDDLREAIRRGEVLHLWSVEMTRIEANRRRYVDFTIDCEDAGLTEVHTRRDGVVSLDEVADIKNVFSYRERKRLRERLKDKMDKLATQGRPRSGALFGYRHGIDAEGRKTLEVVPSEAAAIRLMADMVLAGWSLTNLSVRLNEFNLLRYVFGMPGVLPRRAFRPITVRGEVRVTSPLWNAPKLRSVIKKPTVAGRRIHHGKDVATGTWEPILDMITWKRLLVYLGEDRDIIGADGKPYQVGGPRPPKHDYELTGFLYCGSCGYKLTGKGRRIGEGWQRRYGCIRKVDTPSGCGRLYVVAHAVEAEVETRLLAWLRSPGLAARIGSDPAAGRRKELAGLLGDLKASRLRRAAEWGAGDLDDDEWDVARAGLDQRKAALTAELASLPVPVDDDLDPQAVADDWADATMVERRQLLARFVARIVVDRAIVPGLNRFDPDRLRIEWR